MEQTLGMRIALLRKQKPMTQEELAEKMGVSSQAVSKWENDVSCPDIQLLPRLARLLGVTVDELLSGKSQEVQMLRPEERKSLDQLTLRVRVSSIEGDKIKVNVPMPLVKVALELGMDIIPGVNPGMEGFKNFDLNQVMELAERGLIGRIVEMESADGNRVEVVVD
jgi:transcriptional regulator with XRE-family HTH domain